ncbi:Npun_F0494 family protein [Candidatus Cyanaurora vandensis]|uniref:Npun_F0494 family protein n=1 Tax=Candidatus Cyanaurora vandensis TaxID=2714958 RepID=UPI002579C216|nr:Npun_F0494 family protein [Candidatus Cyanaurora vandensis]
MTSLESAIQVRALRALRCVTVTDQALACMVKASIPLADFVGERGQGLGYSRRPVSQLSAEDDLMWLIRVGVLRREVDGQGITDRFRLTPLGLKIYNGLDRTPAHPLEQGYDWLLRRLPY